MRRAVTAYRRQIFLLMAVYIGLMWLVWPHVHTATSLPLKVALALVPLVPMSAALWLIVMDVVGGDELQQRVHLIALSIATGVTCAASFMAGVLCAAGVLVLGGDDLMWVLPATALIYAAANWVVGRRYGGLGCS
ncbi:MAG TPA: hypothetical protein VFI49_02350 [Rudaea sp.]|nr:hypothetical protein [Rudaea sp.]